MKRRTLLIVNGFLLAALLAGAWFTRTYYYNFIYGPFPVGDEALLAAANDPGNGELLSYVELKDRRLIPTRWAETTTVERRGEKRLHTELVYALVRVGDRFLLVLASKGDDGSRLVGPLYAIHRDIDRKAAAGIERDMPEQAPLLPVMLNATAAFPVAGYLGLGLATPLAILCLVNLARAVARK